MPDRRSFSRRARDEDRVDTVTKRLAGALRLPAAYPHHPAEVGFRQTQMSLLFFAGDVVYKVKKPVNLGYVDYTTLEARQHFCEQEVRLNRRLCPGAYLGVVPIVARGESFLVEGDGPAVEYAVKMRLLPQERTLDRLVAGDLATGEMMRRIAQHVAAFHARAETSDEIDAYGAVASIRRNTDENFEQTKPFIGRTMRQADHELLRTFTDRFLEEHAAEFAARVANRRIRDCHGDLHAAHVCVGDDICIFDCIEFNDRFRYGDVASEVAFLAMDLDRMARSDLSREFVAAYSAASGDGGIERLLPFYGCYRAVVRGKVEGFKLGDDLVPAEEKASSLRLARCYFELARRYATGRGLLVLMSGVTGSGKSTIASALAPLLAGRIISSDVVRKELAGISPVEHRYIPYGSGIYSPERTRQTYQEMLRRAEPVLQGGGCAILDAAFLRGEERIRARDVALRHGSRAVVVECVAPFEVTLRRLAERQAGVSVSDGRAEILERQLPDVEAVAEFAEEDHLRINVSRPLGDILEEIWRKL